MIFSLIDEPPTDLTEADLGALKSSANSPNASEDLIVFFTCSFMIIWHQPLSTIKQRLGLSPCLKTYSLSGTAQQNIFSIIFTLIINNMHLLILVFLKKLSKEKVPLKSIQNKLKIKWRFILLYFLNVFIDDFLLTDSINFSELLFFSSLSFQFLLRSKLI